VRIEDPLHGRRVLLVDGPVQFAAQPGRERPAQEVEGLQQPGRILAQGLTLDAAHDRGRVDAGGLGSRGRPEQHDEQDAGHRESGR
jgi:hypothetical protein